MFIATRTTFRSALAGLLMLAVAASPALSCPFCTAPSLTLAEQVSQADAVVLVQWVEGEKATETTAGKTVYEIKQVTRNHKDSLKAGDRITLPRYRASQVGDLFLLMGSKGVEIEWGSPLEITETSFAYITQAPAPEVPTSKRLEYYVQFLEYPDQLMANDAYGEFANAPYQDIVAISSKFPREKIRQWIADPETPATRMGLYGLLIGLCGNDEDAALVEKKITEKTEEFRLGIDGLMSGYLMLKGAKGLDLIDETKLANRDVPFSETYSAMQALRFMWKYADGRIEKERLMQSMRTLLDRPELADLVIADLARWNDWSIQDRLMTIYLGTMAGPESSKSSGKSIDEFFAAVTAEKEKKDAAGEVEPVAKTGDQPEEEANPYNIPSIKRAIIRYMLVGSKDVPEEAVSGEKSEVSAHVTAGLKYVDMLRKLDPKTVASAERFFFLK
jgi:hypothetical protein